MLSSIIGHRGHAQPISSVFSALSYQSSRSRQTFSYFLTALLRSTFSHCRVENWACACTHRYREFFHTSRVIPVKTDGWSHLSSLLCGIRRWRGADAYQGDLAHPVAILSRIVKDAHNDFRQRSRLRRCTLILPQTTSKQSTGGPPCRRTIPTD